MAKLAGTVRMELPAEESGLTGRPRVKCDLRNFRFAVDVDAFLVTEKTDTKRDMTLLLEVAVRNLMLLKKAERYRLYQALGTPPAELERPTGAPAQP